MFLNRSYSHMDVLTKASITIQIIEDVAIYKAQIFSSNGNIFGAADKNSEIYLVVWKGLEDITNKFTDIIWRRFTSHSSGYQEDLAWGEKHKGKTSFVLTRDEINERAKIQVEVYGSVNGVRRLVATDYMSFIDINDLQGTITPPSNPKHGDLWLDISVSPPRLMMWDANLQKWVEIIVAGKDRRNLIRNSNFYKANFDKWTTIGNPTLKIESLRSKKWARIKSDTSNNNLCGIKQVVDNISAKSNYTFQMLTEIYSQATVKGKALVMLYSINDAGQKTLLKEDIYNITDTAYAYSSKFTTLDDTKKIEVNISGQKQTLFDFIVTNIKLENYPIATEWELAIEDMQDALDNKLSNSHEEVFNSLTDDGRMQGMYTDTDEQGRKNFYFNASYIKSGKLLGEHIEGRNLLVKDDSGNKTFEINDKGEISIRAKTLSIGSSTVATTNTVTQAIQNTVKTVDVMYYLSISSRVPTGGTWQTLAPAWEKGKYIWTKTVTTYMNGEISETDPFCILGPGEGGSNGTNGTNGKDGVGIKSIIEEYYLSTSYTSQVGGEWSTKVPTWEDGKYMWTRSTITYTDNTVTTTKPICVTGGKGDKGDKGESGVGIDSVDVEYYLSTSSTELKGGQWSTTAPTWVNGKFMWSRTKTIDTTGKVTYSKAACITGSKGQAGQGITSITEEYYLSDSKTELIGSTWSTTPVKWSTGKYIWTRSKIVYSNPTSIEYTTPIYNSSWEVLEDIQESIDSKVDDTQEAIFNTLFANGRQGFELTEDGKVYINGEIIKANTINANKIKAGILQANKGSSYLSLDDGSMMLGSTGLSNYLQWTGSSLNIKANSIKIGASSVATGDDITHAVNKAIKTVDVMYYLSTSSVAPTGGTWQTLAPPLTEGKYIWTKTVTVHMDNSTSETNPVCITNMNSGSSGGNGKDGIGIQSIIEEYYLSTSNQSLTGGSWIKTAPAWENGKYIWTRSVITYTDGAIVTTDAICVSGGKGDKGDKGDKGEQGATGESGKNFLTFTTNYSYDQSAINNYSKNGYVGTWAVIESTSKCKAGDTVNIRVYNSTKACYSFIIARINTVNSTSINTTSLGVTENGANGANGAAGVGIKSVDVEYYLSTSSTSLSGGSWSTTAPAWVDGKFMWSRTKTVTTAGTTTYSNAVCITGSKGSTGAPGATGQGITSITEEYYLSTSKTTQTGGSWVATPPAWSVGKYMWTRSKIVYKNPTNTVYTTPLCDSSWEAINEIQIGGRNLLRMNNVINFSSANFTKKQYSVTCTHNSQWEGIVFYDLVNSMELNQNYILQYKVKKTAGSLVCMAQHVDSQFVVSDFTVDGVSRDAVANNGANMGIDDSNWHTCILKFKRTANVDGDGSGSTNRVVPQPNRGLNTSVSVEMKDFKLEKGNKITDWTPAPEDVNSAITDIDKKLETTNNKVTELTTDLNGINASVTTIKTQTELSNNPMTLVAKANFSQYDKPNEGEIYLHGLNEKREPANVNGKCLWNNTIVTLPKVMFNPNDIVADGVPVYMVRNLADNKWWSIWKTKNSSGAESWMRVLADAATDSSIYAHTWNEANDIVVGYYIIKKTNPRKAEAPIVTAQLFNGALNYKQATSMTLVGSISQLELLENEIGLTVQKNNVISSINLYTQENENGTSSGVKIRGDKIDLQGQVTFSSLADSNVAGSIKNVFTQQGNKTVINGGMIQTHTIKGNDLLLKGNLTVSDNNNNNTFEITSNGEINIRAKSLRIGSSHVATNNDINNAISSANSGGTNLATDTNKGTDGWDWIMQSGNVTLSTVVENDIKCCQMYRHTVASSGSNYIRYTGIGRNKYLPSKKYTVSFEIKSSVTTRFRCTLSDFNGQNALVTTTEEADVSVKNEWTKLVFTFTTKDQLPSSKEQVLYLTGMNDSIGVTYIFRNLMIEEGSIPTTWKPSQMDIDSAIDNKVDNTQDAIFNKLFANGEQGFVLENGKVYINGEVIKANTISGNVIKAGTLDAGAITTGIIRAQSGGSYLSLNDGSMMLGSTSQSNYLQWTGSQLNIRANSIRIGGSSIPTAGDIDSAIKNVQVGGRNLAKKGCFSKYNTGYDTTVTDDNFLKDGSVTFSRRSVVNEGPIIDRYVVYEAGQEYVISFKLKKASGTVNSIHVYNGCGHTESSVYIDGVYKGALAQDLTFPNDSNYHKVEIYFKAGNANRGNGSTINTTHTILQPIKNSSNSYTMEVLNFKIEKGNKASDWNPSPEDVRISIDGKVNNVQDDIFNTLFSNGEQGFVLQNGKVYINGEVIQANTLSASKITTGTLSANVIKGSTISAINMSTESATINSAKIGNLDASKITSGTISASRLDASAIVSTINGSSTSIKGDRIKTGVIQANSGGSYFDLNNGQMMLGRTSSSNYLYWNGSQLKVKGYLETCTFRGKNMVYIEDNGILSCDGDTYIRHLSVLETHPGWASGTRGSFDCAPTANFKKEVRTAGEFWAANNTGTYLGVVRRGKYESGIIQVDRIRVVNKRTSSGANNYLEIAGYQSNHVFGADLWSSDITLKENIVSIEDNSNAELLNDDMPKTGLDLINNLNHYAFDYKKSFGGDHVTCGYVAQELQELNDTLVMEVEQQDGTTLLQPKASNIIPNLSLAIKQQQQMIDDLKEEIELLKSKLNI